MSKIANYLEYSVRLGEISRQSWAAINFLSENNRGLKHEDMPTRHYPSNLSDAVIDVSLNAMRRSNRHMMEDISLEASRQDIYSVYQHTGLTPNDLTQHQKHDLKMLKMFVDIYRSDTTFDNLVSNARDNLRASVLSDSKTQGIDPSIMFSISFGNGAGFGRAPDEDQVAKALAENKLFSRVSSDIADAHDEFMKSRGISHRLADHVAELASQVLDVKKLAPIAVAIGLGMGISAVMENSAPELPVAEYATHSDVRLNATAMGGETYFELGEKILKDANLSHSDADVMRYMERAGLGHRQHETLRQGDIVSLVVPENVGITEMSAWSAYGQITEGGVPKSYTSRDLTPEEQRNFVEKVMERINEREQAIEDATGFSRG